MKPQAIRRTGGIKGTVERFIYKKRSPEAQDRLQAFIVAAFVIAILVITTLITDWDKAFGVRHVSPSHPTTPASK